MQFDASGDIDAVKKMFKFLKIIGRIKNSKFLEVGGKAIYQQDRKVFPLP